LGIGEVKLVIDLFKEVSPWLKLKDSLGA
jgi:hypothetical protein